MVSILCLYLCHFQTDLFLSIISGEFKELLELMEDQAAHILEKFKMIAKQIRVVAKCFNENCTVFKILV